MFACNFCDLTISVKSCMDRTRVATSWSLSRPFNTESGISYSVSGGRTILSLVTPNLKCNIKKKFAFAFKYFKFKQLWRKNLRRHSLKNWLQFFLKGLFLPRPGHSSVIGCRTFDCQSFSGNMTSNFTLLLTTFFFFFSFLFFVAAAESRQQRRARLVLPAGLSALLVLILFLLFFPGIFQRFK